MPHRTTITTCLALATILLTSPSNANCPSQKTIFSCTTSKGKMINVCDSPKTIDYFFGKKGATPELALSIPRNTATTRQWDGFGTNMYYSVFIPNGKTVYEVFSQADKSGDATSFGVSVLIGGKEAATILCKADTVIDNIEGVTLKNVQE